MGRAMTLSGRGRKGPRRHGRTAGETAASEIHEDALERMLARLEVQRSCLDFAAKRIVGLPGPILELGLGKGRTYDRIRRILPGRDIFAFDSQLHCPESLRPSTDQLFLGDFRDTLRSAFDRLGQVVAMIHADIGSENPARDARLVDDIGPLIEALVRDRGLVLSDRRLTLSGSWKQLSLPPDATRAAWPYFIWVRQR